LIPPFHFDLTVKFKKFVGIGFASFKANTFHEEQGEISFLSFSRSIQHFKLKSVSAEIVPVILSIGDCHPTHLLLLLSRMVSCRFRPDFDGLDLEG
jgi:hypothetical protein